MTPKNRVSGRLLLSGRTWIALAIIALAFHVAWAIFIHNGAPIARCGAFWILLGMIVVARQILRLGAHGWYEYTIYGNPAFDPKEDRPELREWNTEERIETLFDTVAAQRTGPLLIFLGTALWGYGDLIGNVFLSN